MLTQLPQPKTKLSRDALAPYWPAVFEQFGDIAVLLDSEAEIQYSNPAWKNFAQPTEAALLALQAASLSAEAPQYFKAWLYPEDILKFQCALMSREPKKLLLRLLAYERPLAWFELNIQPIFEDSLKSHLLGWCLLGTEQTLSIQQQHEQGAAQRSLQDLLQRLPVMLYRSRNDWNWTMDYVSSGCESLTGYSAQALINTPLYGQLIHPDDQQSVWDQIQFALQNHTVFYLQYRLITAQHNIIQVREVGQGLYSQSDMVLGVEGAVFDY